MFNKSILKNLLPAALCLVSVGAYAQEEVTLANGSKQAWSEVVKALNNAKDLSLLEQAVTNAQTAASVYEPKTTTGVAETVQDQIDGATEFGKAYTEYYGGDTSASSKASLWYKQSKNIEQEVTLYLSFAKEAPETAGWTNATVGDFYTKYTSKSPGEQVEEVYVYLDGSYVIVPGYTQAAQRQMVNTVVNYLTNTVPTLKSYQKNVTTPEYQEKLDAVTTALQNLTDAQEAQNNYKTITLNKNISAEATIDNFAGTINGNGCVITVPSGKYAFSKFNGELSGAAVNGAFASNSNGASFVNVALWNNNKGTYYNGNAAAAENLTLGALAFAARENFGVAGGELAKVTDANRVYDITVYENAANSFQSYVTYANGEYTDVDNNETVTVGYNVFVKSATSDLSADNVIYNGKANNVVITDRFDFFCPESITAANVTYTREFNEGKNSVCLPFTISTANIAGAKFATFEKEEEGIFWFKYQTSAIEANTPMLLVANAKGTLKDVKNVKIAATPAKQIVDGTNGDHGLLKNADPTEILGASEAEKVYGLANDGLFYYAGEADNLPAFRMVITCAEAPVTNKAPRKIAFIGEDNETNAVEAISDNAAALEVAGGYGELTINAAADCGNVAVYTMDGKVAANANVAAGTTTVNLSKGVYVVMGKKVVVK